MKRIIRMLLLTLVLSVTVIPVHHAQAQIAILEIIKAGIKKVIKAVDLGIQRQQNRVIWLQNAQKVLENTLSKLKLQEIGDWTEKQRAQYQKYFDELRKVKMLISYYQRIKDITEKQVKLVEEYNRGWKIIREDRHFAYDEIQYMGKVYSGILDATVKNIDQLAMIVNSFRTDMTDAKRLEIINQVGDQVDVNFTDLKTFNGENAMLSLQRAKSENEAALVRQLYGIGN